MPFGRVDEEGRVWVKDGEAERQIGQFPAEVPENPLNIYVRRYLDIAAQISLFAERLPRLAEREIDQTMKSLREQVSEPAAVGDLPALRVKIANKWWCGPKKSPRKILLVPSGSTLVKS